MTGFQKIALTWLTMMLACASSAIAGIVYNGGDLTYTHKGSDVYEVTLRYFVKCTGAGGDILPPTCSLTAKSTDVPDKNVNLNFISSEIIQTKCDPVIVVLALPAASVTSSPCNNMLMVYTYRGTITLSEKRARWILSVANGANRPAVGSQTGTANTLHLEAMVNNLKTGYNNSASILVPPMTNTAANSMFHYNTTSVDVDNHTLKYELVRPQLTESTTLSYHSDYEYQNPFGKQIPTQSDGLSGSFVFTPRSGFVSTRFAIRVNEYAEDGELMGYSTHDNIVGVAALNSLSKSQFMWLSDGGSTNIHFRATDGSPLTIKLNTNEYTPDASSTFINTLTNLPGSFTFSTDNIDGVADPNKEITQATITWTPQLNNFVDETFYMKVYVGDKSCDQYYSQVYTLSITVGPAAPNTGHTYCEECISSFAPEAGKKFLASGWVKENTQNLFPDTYENTAIEIIFNGAEASTPIVLRPSGPIIEGWQKIEGVFEVPEGTVYMHIALVNDNEAIDAFFDDIRIHPLSSNMKSYVYDASTQRLVAELDANNFATFYEYDDEGSLIRLKKETEKGVVTIKEQRMNQTKVFTK